ncbi:hypothetical protein VTJ49DRAFT_3363 [Mycothermus thermophilus]|uniref:Uncharacterized protein n=1 Tax=Humicola insolens TaxID=85995 RepID=A0ABR3V869_HUMIN
MNPDDVHNPACAPEVAPKRGPGRPPNPVSEPPSSNRRPGRPKKDQNPQAKRGLGGQPPNALDNTPKEDRDDTNEFMALLPTAVISESWSQANEDSLVAAWNQHPSKAAIAKKCKKLKPFGAELKLWRHAFASLRALPIDIIDFRKNMVADCSSSSQFHQRRQVPQLTLDNIELVLWSSEFSFELMKVIDHNAWEGRASLLRFAIQYVVTCATDDRRPWALDAEFCDPFNPFLWRLAKRMRENTTDVPAEDIHAAVWQEVSESLGYFTRPWWSRLFLAIEELTRDERELKRIFRSSLLRSQGPETVWMPYVVRKDDLTCLKTALQKADGGLEVSLPRELVPVFLTVERYEAALNRVWMSWFRLLKQGLLPSHDLSIESGWEEGILLPQ